MDILATDRHPTIQKLMREKYPGIQHEYDLWHIVKGVKKRLVTSKVPELTPWVRSVGNHLWYCASTCNRNPKLLKEKWASILHHITDEHEWVTGELLHKCEHPPYSKDDPYTRPWLERESKAFEVLKKVVMEKKLLQDLEKVACPLT